MDGLEVQKQYDLLREKVSRLRNARAVETDIPTQIKLDQQLIEAADELSNFEKKIEFVEGNKLTLHFREKGHKIHCVFGRKVTIGRSSTCDFCVKDGSALISNLQAIVSYDDSNKEYWIEDLKSANGTYINNERLRKSVRLSWGDKVGLSASCSFIFEHNQDDPLASGVFIQHSSAGKEINRYIIAPKNRLLVGSNSNEFIRFPIFRENRSLGSIEKKDDGFYFLGTDNNEKLLVDNTELLIDFLKVQVSIANIAIKSSFDSTEVETSDSKKTQEDFQEIERPSEDAKPSYLWKINTFLGFSILLLGLFNFIFLKPKINQIGYKWVDASLKSFEDEDKRFQQNLDWPPQEPVNIVFLKASDNAIEQYFIAKSNITEKDFPVYLDLQQFSRNFILEQSIQKRFPEEPWLGIGKIQRRGFLQLQVTYWIPQSLASGVPVFEFRRTRFLYWHSIISLFFVTALASGIRYLVISHHRNKLKKEYEDFQRKRTTKIFETKSQLNEARSLAQEGDLAKALIATNRLLELTPRTIPVYQEILDLKKIILIQIESGGGAITVSSLKNQGNSYSSGGSTSLKLLYLRILGTPYAYQAPYGLEDISIGRQRRKQGEIEVGNDIVIRVPGSDQKSLRISRKHLEIKRIDTEYFVVDKSGGRTKLNQKKLIENQPSRLQTRDRLSIANVLTLEVLIRTNITGYKTSNIIRMNSPALSQDKLLIEASVGDMMTEVSYEED